MKIVDFNANVRLTEGLAYNQQGRLDDAEACYLDVIETEPSNTEALKLLAVVMVARGELEDALSYAAAAVDLQPENGDYRHLLGRIQLDFGDLEAARVSLSGALTKAASDPLNLNLDLAECHGACGAWDDALGIAEAQAQANPGDARALSVAGNAAAALDRNELALGYFERAAAVNGNDPALWVSASKAHRALGDLEHAWLCIERALSLAPNDPNIHFVARIVRGEAVPAWHFNMMNDAARNAAFKRTMERQIKPHHVVLEIGTGAGLLAMMASRTGARIFTCESNAALANTARGLIACNRLTERITVIDGPSWELEVEKDIPGKVDVLLAEIFSAQLVSEEVIPTIEDAKRRLLKPGGIVIPAAATMMGALVHGAGMAALIRVSTIEGFDFTSFNAFTPVLMNLDTPNTALEWLSEPVSLFHFDFQNQDEFPAESGQVGVEVTQDGLCQGVVQWLQIMLDNETLYENAPLGPGATRTKHWTPLFYPFPIPRELKKGQTVMLRIGHDRKGARVELAEIL